MVDSVTVDETFTDDGPVFTVFTPPFVPSATPSTSSTPSAPSTPSTFSPMTTSTPKSSAAASPVTSLILITQSGTVVTQTVTSTPTSPSSALPSVSKSSGIAPGFIAAAVIASIAGVVLLLLALFWCWRRRQTAIDAEKYGSPMQSRLDRNTSVHSNAGLLDKAYPPTITTRLGSAHINPSSDAISPVSMGSERRNSKPMLYDQRLNPNALMVHDNGSRSSLKTLEDHRDYGRVLKVVNPDHPNRPSFSSQPSYER